MNDENYIAILDFGSQTTNLIARRIREMGVKSEVLSHDFSAVDLRKKLPKAIILSGSPASLLDEDAPTIDENIFNLGIPILGICYGMQLIAKHFGGGVKKTGHAEFGRTKISFNHDSSLFFGFNTNNFVWMSHHDQAYLLNSDFKTTAFSSNCAHVAIENNNQKIFGVQFHPEVSHTDNGEVIIKNFIFNIAQAEKNYFLEDLINKKIGEIKLTVGSDSVIMGLSGGVDSSVAALLIHKAIGQQLHCVYVNHGLHRQGEIEEVKNLFTQVLDIELTIVDAQEYFFAALQNITDPEQKRKKIGHVFVEIFEKEAKRLKNIKFLGQGTLYPDVIESFGQKSSLIKSHHNVGGLPAHMNLSLLEPLRDLFKDEVRIIGKLLGLSDQVLMRQPFPGPGLAVRIPGEVNQKRVELLRNADAIVLEEVAKAKIVGLWQWFAILLPIKSVGLMGDARSMGETIAIRAVTSIDGMTADWAKLPYDLLAGISSRITNEVRGISRVLYDISQKPPGTIEWE